MHTLAFMQVVLFLSVLMNAGQGYPRLPLFLGAGDYVLSTQSPSATENIITHHPLHSCAAKVLGIAIKTFPAAASFLLFPAPCSVRRVRNNSPCAFCRRQQWPSRCLAVLTP